jgi:hypothetical protein
MRRRLLVLVMSVAAGLSAQAADLTLESPRSRTHLLELFTSEGCSSCPPAEAWLSKLKDDPRLWREFVPLAFHVDYWDRLGWRDPFAAKQWTARQYGYSASWQSSSVYTPGFVLDGREWRDRSLPSSPDEEAGVLKIASRDGDVITANFTPAGRAGSAYDVHVARLGFDLAINVKAGENSGRKLLHDFVVLSLADAPLNGGSAELRLAPIAAKETPPREAIAAWVTERGKLEPLQAVGGWR